MKWDIGFSKQAAHFINTETITEQHIITLAAKGVQYFSGEDVNIDIKKMKGAWNGFFRIRKGKLRIVVEFDFDAHTAFVELVDWRGNVDK